MIGRNKKAPKVEEEKKEEVVQKKERYIDYQQRIAPIKQEILNIGERNMENTIRVIRRWLKDDMRIINQDIAKKFGKTNT